MSEIDQKLTGPRLIRKKLYNALTGQELKKLIIDEVTRELDSDSKFRNILTYPNVHFRWQLVVRSYPNEPPEFNKEIEQSLHTEDFNQDPLQEVDERVYEGGQAIEQPDKIREEAVLTGAQKGAAPPSSKELDPDSDAFQPRDRKSVV